MSNKYKNIIVCGDMGTGTSTLANGLAKRLGWEHIAAGDIFREYQKNNRIPLWNTAAIPKELDNRVDEEFFRRMKNSKHIVFDSHYGGWFARDLDSVFRILLTADKEVSAKRIIERQHTHQETSKEIVKRRNELRAKFKKLYSDDNYEDTKYFNLVIDTTHTGVEETINKSIEAFENL